MMMTQWLSGLSVCRWYTKPTLPAIMNKQAINVTDKGRFIGEILTHKFNNFLSFSLRVWPAGSLAPSVFSFPTLSLSPNKSDPNFPTFPSRILQTRFLGQFSGFEWLRQRIQHKTDVFEQEPLLDSFRHSKFIA